MIKKLLLTVFAAASVLSTQAQVATIQQAPTIPARSIPGNITANTLHKNVNAVATVNCVDTNLYAYYKNAILSPTVSYASLNSTMANKNALGYSYTNTGTITVTGLGFIAVSGNTNIAVPTIAYLYNVNGTGQPTTKIDSTIVNVTTAKFYYGTLITAARTLTTNFAVVFKTNSTVATHTVALYVTPAQTAAGTSNRFGEGRGYFSTAAGSFTAMNTYFGAANDYEPIVFPIYSYNLTSDYTATPASPMCITSTLVNTNTSLNMGVPENYMFNFAKFCKKWNVPATGIDSVYTWNFSDGTGRFKVKNQNHVYSTTGTFNDSLIFTNIHYSNSPDCIDKKVTPITVVAQPTVMVSPATSTVCTGATATLTASGAATYVWDGGQATASATFAPSANSTYSVTGTNACGTATASANVAVTSVAVINAASSSTAICAGQSSTLNVSGATTYTWAPATSLSSANGSTVTSTPASTTVYTITGTSSCGTATTTVTQNVTPLPSVTVTASSASVCSGAPVTFTASGATTYAWMPGGSTNAILSVTPTSSATYTVMGTASGCSGSSTVAVSVVANPTITVNASSTTICAGSTATLTANGNGAAYLWSTGAMTPVITVTPATTTSYTVGTANSSSCTATTSIMITVNTCTGIEELSGATINVYPNPNNGVLNISVSSELASNSTIQIFDALGKLVIAQNLVSEHTTVNTSALSNGVYIFKVMNGETPVKIGRMIKQ